MPTYFGIQTLLAAWPSCAAPSRRRRGSSPTSSRLAAQLQDAVPMTLGQEFAAFAAMLADDERRLRESAYLMCEINMGGTAIGTGINAPVGYVDVVTPELAQLSGVPVKAAANLIAATSDTGAFCRHLRRAPAHRRQAVQDQQRPAPAVLRPAGGRGRHQVAAAPGGSSIMPGKVNPVIPEVMNQVCFEVIGNDVAITMACEAGQLQLNAFGAAGGLGPAQDLHHLASACQTLQVNCVEGIVANQNLLDERIAESVTLVTALNPLIGYEKAAAIARPPSPPANQLPRWPKTWAS